MAPIHGLFHEIRFELLKVVVLNSFLDAIILFLGLLLVLSIFSMSLIWPLLIALIFFIVQIRRYNTKFSLEYIEARNPTVREMLRTAADNKGADTLMAHALFAELIEKVRTISSGTFLNFRRLSLKLGTVFALSILLVSLAFFNVNIQQFENPLASLEGTMTNYWQNIFGEANNTPTNVSEGGDIYGEPSLAKLGNKAVDITLQQGLNQIDFNKVSAANQSGTAPDNYPVDVSAKASQAYTGGLQDVNDRKTAADYSQEIKK
jgi:hypothetical protein